MIQVLLVDDGQELPDPAACVVTRAREGNQVLVTMQLRHFDVVVLDIELPGLDGMGLLRQIKALHPAVRVLVLTGDPTAETRAQMIRSGALGCLTKPQPAEVLWREIRQAYEATTIPPKR